MDSIYKVIGLMSGTSLDGLDIAAVTIRFSNETWSFDLGPCDTLPYSTKIKTKLKEATKLAGEELSALDIEVGNFMGESVSNFISKNNFKPDLICSHGHTVFHQPQRKLNLQIGSAACINAHTEIVTINDFRSLDIQLGGQGAPLVPVGDHYLFKEFDACLNLGGIANISYVDNNQRRAFDICAFNMVFNHFAAVAGYDFDNEGQLARLGIPNSNLINSFDNLKYYSTKPPKSLGFEDVNRDVIQIISANELTANDILRTWSEHAANRIAKTILSIGNPGTILITGGGAYNTFFIELLGSKLQGTKLIIPEKEIIEYKEALIFAFLGVLRWRGEENVFSSVTGASRNSCSGSIIGISK